MTLKDYPYLYHYSLDEAKIMNQEDLWKESYHLNIACKVAIEAALKSHGDGDFLSPHCAGEILDIYGFKRVGWVLANSIQHRISDPAFSLEHKEWANDIFIPDEDNSDAYSADSFPALLDKLLSQYHVEIGKLQLFTAEHCIPTSGQELSGKVLVLSRDTLKESCWDPKNQLWLAKSGFGCSASARGNAVYCTCLGDGENARWERYDFTGILKDEFLPEWAKEKLEELQTESKPDITM